MTQVSGFYLHVPFCRHLCNYCDFYKRRFEFPQKQIEEFHRSLMAGLEEHNMLMQQHHVEWAPLETLYLGGGTPSLWGMEGAHFIGQGPIGQLVKSQELEFTMEVDPGTWTPELLSAWEALGMNRISIGTQTLDPEFLKIMDRSHGLEETVSLMSFCHENDLNFSVDFLLGLPFSRQKNRNIRRELDELLKFSPKHVSLYILNARSRYPHVQALPEDEFIREEYLFVSDYLRSKGFLHYEVSNFALPGYESKHNMKYWRSDSVAALGPTGTGLFVLGAESAVRYKWKVSEAKAELEKLGKEELELERTYLSLRTSEGLTPVAATDDLIRTFQQWQGLHYGHWDGQTMRLNSLGFLMLDSLMGDLFRLPCSAKAL